jgi:hypothetical protein
LSAARQAGEQGMVAILIDMGADTSLVTADGMTPMAPYHCVTKIVRGGLTL